MIQIVSDCDPNLLGPKHNQIQDIANSVLKFYNIRDAEISIIFGDDDLLNRIKPFHFCRVYLDRLKVVDLNIFVSQAF